MPGGSKNQNNKNGLESPITAADLEQASLASRALITIAERRDGMDAARCRLVLLHLEAARLLRQNLQRVLARRNLTELQFAVLTVLFSTEPEPMSASVLSEHAGVSRAAMTDALDKLEALGFTTRTRDDFDRRFIYLRITPEGQHTVDAAINDYLHAAADAAREVTSAAQRELLIAYLQLLRGAIGRNHSNNNGSSGS